MTISTRRGQIEALQEKLDDRDTTISRLREEIESMKRELQRSPIQHARELGELRDKHQRESLQLQKQIECLNGELMRAQQQVYQEEVSRNEIEEKYTIECSKLHAMREEHLKALQSKNEYMFRQISDNQSLILDQLSRGEANNDQQLTNEVAMALSKLKVMESHWTDTVNAVRLDRKTELESHEVLLKEMGRNVARISAEISTPSDKVGDDIKHVLNSMHELRSSASIERKQTVELFDKERAVLAEQLSFYQIEKRRYADETVALREELRLCKDELAKEHDELEDHKVSFFRQKEENDKILRIEEVSLEHSCSTLACNATVLTTPTPSFPIYSVFSN